jgi:hypothetical protein
MVWRSSTIDPTADVATDAVLDAFERARGAGLPSVECYRAGDSRRQGQPARRRALTGAARPLFHRRAMIERPPPTPPRRAGQVSRDERLGLALRENLRRRKEQARAKAPPVAGTAPPPGSDVPGGDDPPA